MLLYIVRHAWAEERGAKFPDDDLRPLTDAGRKRFKKLVRKLVKRGVSLKALDASEPRASGRLYKIGATLQNGLTQEQAKKITKVIREEAPRTVRSQVQGDEVRVSAKKKDDLQAVIALLKQQDFDFALQFVNYR